MSRFKSGHNESTQREMVFEARCYAEFFLIEPIGMQIMLYLFVACVHLRFFRESSLPATEGYSMDFDGNRSWYRAKTLT